MGCPFGPRHLVSALNVSRHAVCGFVTDKPRRAPSALASGTDELDELLVVGAGVGGVDLVQEDLRRGHVGETRDGSKGSNAREFHGE